MLKTECGIQDYRATFLDNFLGQQHELSVGQRTGRLKERTQSAEILGQVLLDTRRVYAFFEVME